MTNIREQFPIFDTNPGLVYLDNAATMQKPHSVIEAMVDFYTHTNANVHRGIYPLSEAATELFELSRRKVAKFINAEPEEIIFTSGTTDSLNSVAASLEASKMLGPNPRVVLTTLEHHSDLLPWQRLKGVELVYLDVNENYEVEGFGGIEPRQQLTALPHVSNVTGTIADIKKVRGEIGNSLLVLDAAQSIGHMPVDVKKLGVDFMAFSAHKMYGPTGIGVLYGKREHLERMEPFRVGGGMIREVHRDHATWADIPTKFEAGTPAIAEVVGLAAAIDFIEELGWEEIHAHERELAQYLGDRLGEVPGIQVFHPQPVALHAGVFSFAVSGVHPHDLAQILGADGVAIRAGHHCTQPLHEKLGVSATARASIAIYNDKSDVDKLIEGINKAIKVLEK